MAIQSQAARSRTQALQEPSSHLNKPKLERFIVGTNLLMGEDLITFVAGRQFGTVLVDPPWRFANRTGKMAPEHKRLSRYVTLSMEEIAALPVGSIVAPTAHLYLWVPNALLPFGLKIMEAWGFEYKSNI